MFLQAQEEMGNLNPMFAYYFGIKNATEINCHYSDSVCNINVMNYGFMCYILNKLVYRILTNVWNYQQFGRSNVYLATLHCVALRVTSNVTRSLWRVIRVKFKIDIKDFVLFIIILLLYYLFIFISVSFMTSRWILGYMKLISYQLWTAALLSLLLS